MSVAIPDTWVVRIRAREIIVVTAFGTPMTKLGAGPIDFRLAALFTVQKNR